MRLNRSLTRAAWAALSASLLVACGESRDTRFEADEASGTPARAPEANRTPPPPRVPPEIPDVTEADLDGNRVDDALDREIAELEAARDGAASLADAAEYDARLAEPVRVLVMFREPIGDKQLAAFEANGGSIKRVFRNVGYGFSATLPLGGASAAAEALGESLLLVERGKKVVLHLDEATRTGRVRSTWAQNFAGFSAGFSASSTINIAIVDTGVDATHPDLAGRGQYWIDSTSDEEGTPVDIDSHGTHVASIALGSGAAFGVGPAPLLYTDSRNLSTFSAGQYSPSPLHLPASSLTVAGTATWSGGTSTAFSILSAPDGSAAYEFLSGALAVGTSPRGITTTFTPSASSHYTFALQAPATTYTVQASVSNYPAVGDGFPALRGVASNARWAGVKVFTNDGESDGLDLLFGLDDLLAEIVANSVKVVNLSLGLDESGQQDAFFRAGVNTLVANGTVVVVSAGNHGPTGIVADPGRARRVITVGASSDANRVTSYTSQGFAGPGSSEGTKPDVLAPGGSVDRSLMLAADTNGADVDGIPDARQNDYSQKQGTSMAAPFTSGAAALVIQALESTGVTWTFDNETQPLLVKMLLGASATETNANREGGTSNPTLGRASAPKDLNEGWGMINPDAAIEAVRLDLGTGFTDSTGGGVYDRRAWGRRVALTSGSTLNVTLDVPAGADFDLYLYADRPLNEGTAAAEGEPNRLASSTNASQGADETLSYSATSAGTRYLFVKRVSGSGSFTLVAGTPCGNGSLDAGEGCDDGNVQNGDCCSSTCQPVTNGTGCNDGNACTRTDTCQAGSCVGANSVVCTASDACHDAGTCAPASGTCSNPPRPDDSSCPNGSCQAGVCTPDPGTGGMGGTSGTSGTSGSGGAGRGGSGGSTAGVGGSVAGLGGGGVGGSTAGVGGSVAGLGGGGVGGSTAGTAGLGGSTAGTAGLGGVGAGGTTAGVGGGGVAGTGQAGRGGSPSAGAGNGGASGTTSGNGGSPSGAGGTSGVGGAGNAGSPSGGSGNGGVAGAQGGTSGGIAGGGTSSGGGAGEAGGGSGEAGEQGEAGAAGSEETGGTGPKRNSTTTRTNGGCGCDVPGKQPGSTWPLLLTAFAAVLGSRRRLRRRTGSAVASPNA